jgi:hypothetical protein
VAKENAITARIFAGYDAGFFTLPEELVTRREAEVRIADELKAVNERMRKVLPAAIRTKIARDIIEKAVIPPNFVAPFMKSQDELRRLSAEESILAEARDNLRDGASSLAWMAMLLSEDILAKHLRPAMEAVLDGIRGGAATVGRQVPWGDTRALVRASEEVREYHESCLVAAQHLEAIRDAQRRLKDLTGSPGEEAFYNFGQLRNMDRIWPGRGSLSDRFKGNPPWPEDAAQRMYWLVSSEAEPWLPTAEECDLAYAALLSKVTVVRGLAVPTRCHHISRPALYGRSRRHLGQGVRFLRRTRPGPIPRRDDEDNPAPGRDCGNRRFRVRGRRGLRPAEPPPLVAHGGYCPPQDEERRAASDGVDAPRSHGRGVR